MEYKKGGESLEVLLVNSSEAESKLSSDLLLHIELKMLPGVSKIEFLVCIQEHFKV